MKRLLASLALVAALTSGAANAAVVFTSIGGLNNAATGATTTAGFTTTAAIAAGHPAFILVVINSNTATVNTLTSPNNGSWTQVGSAFQFGGAGAGKAFIFQCPSSCASGESSGAAITITLSAANFFQTMGGVIDGAATTTTDATGIPTPPSSAALVAGVFTAGVPRPTLTAPSSAILLGFGATGQGDGGAYTDSAGWSTTASQGGTSNRPTAILSYLLVTSNVVLNWQPKQGTSSTGNWGGNVIGIDYTTGAAAAAPSLTTLGVGP